MCHNNYIVISYTYINFGWWYYNSSVYETSKLIDLLEYNFYILILLNTKTISCFILGVIECNDGSNWSSKYSMCFFDYGKNGCKDNSDCLPDTGLICNTKSTCNCPLLSEKGMCDCPRWIGNEYYWSGNTCQAAHNYGDSCTSIETNYQCQTLTQATICNDTGSGFICQCPHFQFFNKTKNTCVDQLTINESCFYDQMCKTSVGLSCITGICRLLK